MNKRGAKKFTPYRGWVAGARAFERARASRQLFRARVALKSKVTFYSGRDGGRARAFKRARLRARAGGSQHNLCTNTRARGEIGKTLNEIGYFRGIRRTRLSGRNPVGYSGRGSPAVDPAGRWGRRGIRGIVQEGASFESDANSSSHAPLSDAREREVAGGIEDRGCSLPT